MLEIKDLRLIQALFDHGTFTRAARSLNVPQPVVSRNLQVLEIKLGRQLFIRKKTGSVPTDLARMIVSRADDVLRKISDIENNILDLQGNVSTDLSVIAGAFSLETLLDTVAAKFIASKPRTRLILKSTSWVDVELEILERKSIIGLVHYHGQSFDSSLTFEILRSHPTLFFARPNHPLATRQEVQLADIMAYPVVSIPHLPSQIIGPRLDARREASVANTVYPTYPAVTLASPKVSLGIIKKSDAIISATVACALDDLRQGNLIALRWMRPPWAVHRPTILMLRNRTLTQEGHEFLSVLRAVDEEVYTEEIAWCTSNGFPVEHE